MNNLRGKNLGKILIIICAAIIGLYSNYYSYYYFFEVSNVDYESCVVLGKATTMTHHKHSSSQNFVLSVLFDKQEYGMQDINTTFSWYNRLNVGDRVMFKPHVKTSFGEELYNCILLMLAAIFDFAIFVVLIGFICYIISTIWNY